MKIFVSGGSGQLGSDLVAGLRQRGHEVVAPTRQDFDLGWPADRLGAAVKAAAPDVVVNCAAMTDVEGCETRIDEAMQSNRDAPAAIATTCKEIGARLVHISTDYVFAGKQNTPYREDDPTGPINVYGESKLAGEQAIHAVLPEAVILRTSWVYGVHGKNFVKAILNKALQPDATIKVVSDQVGAPTWTGDLCHVIAELAKSEAGGVFHFSNAGVASWYDLAVAIVEIARQTGFDIRSDQVSPVSTADSITMFGIKARRPQFSLLDSRKAASLVYGDDGRVPYWRDSLRQMLQALSQA